MSVNAAAHTQPSVLERPVRRRDPQRREIPALRHERPVVATRRSTSSRASRRPASGRVHAVRTTRPGCVRDPERRLRVACEPPCEARRRLERVAVLGRRGRRSRRGPSPSGRGRAACDAARRLPAGVLDVDLERVRPVADARPVGAPVPFQVAFHAGDVRRLPGADERRSLEQLRGAARALAAPSRPGRSCRAAPSPLGENARGVALGATVGAVVSTAIIAVRRGRVARGVEAATA